MSKKFDKAQSPARSPKLSTISFSASQLAIELEKPDVEILRIVELIQRDPNISEKVLRMASSPLYGVGRSINTIGEAVVVLGFQTIRQHCVTAPTPSA